MGLLLQDMIRYLVFFLFTNIFDMMQRVFTQDICLLQALSKFFGNVLQVRALPAKSLLVMPVN